MHRYLDVAGQKNSNFYVYNGLALFVGWLVYIVATVTTTILFCPMFFVKPIFNSHNSM
jgi:hypothetical protein